MNKSDKIWVALLVMGLAGYLYWSWTRPEKPAEVAPVMPPAAMVQEAPAATPPVLASSSVGTAEATPAVATTPEECFVLSDDEVTLTFSNLGGRLLKAELKAYKAKNEDDSPCMVLPTGDLLDLQWPGATQPLVYTLKEQTAKALTLATVLPTGVSLERTITLEPDYVLSVKDEFLSATSQTLAPYTLSAGSFLLTDEQGDLLGVDALAYDESKPEYYESELGSLLGAGSAFLGCGTTTDPTGVDLARSIPFKGAQQWVALKNRFFVSLTMPPAAADGTLTIQRDPLAKVLKIDEVSARFNYPEVPLQAGVKTPVTTRLYVGPKKLTLLDNFGTHADRVMDFGFFTWVCNLMLPLLNLFYALIPNYGVAILLLTLFVRILFWPLTHKSTVAMRKMSTVQPLIKEVQQKFKDQPQKIQQETFKIYREHQVNPFSSCLPMLIQIPIFIALFVVLRSAVELRFASFLWIADLSQPENLFAGILPVPLNILPILTAVTMGLQTHLTPSTGDAAQKKMMTWMMPIMLLFMFYQMASALCLYWTMSQILSILQTWHIHRQAAKTTAVTK